MKRREVIVIRIGLSIESADPITVEPDMTDGMADNSAQTNVTPSPSKREQPPRRFVGRDTRPTEVGEGDNRGMSEAQKRALFRLAYGLGDRDSALGLILDALGVDRLEMATRAEASRAIGILEAKRNGRPRPTNGAGHA